MSSQAGKLAPLVLTVVGAGYCVYPYAQTQPPPAAAKSDMPKIEAKWLSPSFPPASPRNLFQPVIPESLVAAAKTADEAKLRLAKQAEIEAKKRDASRALLEGWTLGATMMHGARRGAVVNGKIYLEGQTIPPPGPGGEPLSLFRVERDRVVMLRAKRTDEVVLVYAPPAKADGPAKALGPRPPEKTAPKASHRARQVDGRHGRQESSPTPEVEATPADPSHAKDPAAAEDAAKPRAPASADSDEGRQS